MKLVTYQTALGERRTGALTEDHAAVVDLKTGAAAIGAGTAVFENMLATIEAGDGGLETIREIMAAVRGAARAALTPRASVALCAPVPVPQQMREEHQARGCARSHLRVLHFQ